MYMYIPSVTLRVNDENIPKVQIVGEREISFESSFYYIYIYIYIYIYNIQGIPF